MTVTLLDLHCLNALCDDYENIDAITAEVRASAHGNISNEEVEDCIRNLVGDGLVLAYEFNPRPAKYAPVHALGADLSRNWFFISDKGRNELDQNWVEG